MNIKIGYTDTHNVNLYLLDNGDFAWKFDDKPIPNVGFGGILFLIELMYG